MKIAVYLPDGRISVREGDPETIAINLEGVDPTDVVDLTDTPMNWVNDPRFLPTTAQYLRDQIELMQSLES